MPIRADILDRRATDFVLWRPNDLTSAPVLLIGQLKPGNPPSYMATGEFPLTAVADRPGLWHVAAADCGLTSGQVYHYWFDIEDTASPAQPTPHVRCTDPFATAVDWRLFPPGATDNTQPAAVIAFVNGVLVPADSGGEVGNFAGEPSPDTLPVNSQLVIYELPTAWTMSRGLHEPERAVGTFRDVRALVDPTVGGANFAGLSLLEKGQAHLVKLGINAIELLPPADSFYKREWGYDTGHFLAPDAELGFPEGNASPTANADLTALVLACHQRHIRVFIDAVMAFGAEEAYQHIDRPDFCIDDPGKHPGDPDASTSGRGDGTTGTRYGFGSVLFRYTRSLAQPAYDPLTGDVLPQLVPARQLMYTYLTRWMRDFHIDGIRMDSVENVANWDFVVGFKDLARRHFQTRWTDAGLGAGADARFLVVGEELTLPPALLSQGRLDGLWNDSFHGLVRAAILGELTDGGPVRQAINCLGSVFTDGAQAINYLTSHDVEGWRRERLFTMLSSLPSFDDREKRIKLAFVCLLTAVGIPMILAGEEFADEHDFFDAKGHVTQDAGKQINPVNFSRVTGPADPNKPDEVAKLALRQRVFAYVAALVQFRTTQPALAVNDTTFPHEDFTAGKRVVVWQRGGTDQDPVIVVANFSAYQTPNGLTDPNAEYRVPNWPATPLGRSWREVAANRPVRPEQVGREAIFAWEAKVYTLA